MKYVLKKADQTEVEEIFSLYLKRIQWMNEKGINQYYESMRYEMAETCKDGGMKAIGVKNIWHYYREK